jgi:hypothetical protein
MQLASVMQAFSLTFQDGDDSGYREVGEGTPVRDPSADPNRVGKADPALERENYNFVTAQFSKYNWILFCIMF